jgi:hypothetical protein
MPYGLLSISTGADCVTTPDEPAADAAVTRANKFEDRFLRARGPLVDREEGLALLQSPINRPSTFKVDVLARVRCPVRKLRRCLVALGPGRARAPTVTLKMSPCATVFPPVGMTEYVSPAAEPACASVSAPPVAATPLIFAVSVALPVVSAPSFTLRMRLPATGLATRTSAFAVPSPMTSLRAAPRARYDTCVPIG